MKVPCGNIEWKIKGILKRVPRVCVSFTTDARNGWRRGVVFGGSEEIHYTTLRLLKQQLYA